MSLENFIDEKIQEAMAKGEFDDLPGRGKPIDLSDYFATPEDRRITYSVFEERLGPSGRRGTTQRDRHPEAQTRGLPRSTGGGETAKDSQRERP
jgi:hypothetical protein